MSVNKKYLISALNSSLQREYFTYGVVEYSGSSSTTAVPKMMSNTTPEGEASASSEHNPGAGIYKPYFAFDRSNLTGTNTYWRSLGATALPHWIEYKFNTPKIINKYRFDNTNMNETFYPVSWTVNGSNNRTDWVVLDTKSNQGGTGNPYIYTASFNNSTPYLYYRVIATAVSSNTTPVWNLSELLFYEALPVYGLVSMGIENPSSEDYIDKGFDDATLALLTNSNMYSTLNSPELSLYVEDPEYQPVPVVTSSGSEVETSTPTQIDLRNYAGINGVTIDGNGIRILASLDGGTTWYNRKRIIGYSGSETTTAIPAMTSNTAPSGEASGSTPLNTNYEPYRAFDRVLSGNCYVANVRCSVASPTILQYKFTTPTVINKYGFCLYQANGACLPKDWTYQASVDGTDWVILDTKSVTGLSNGVQTVYQYPINNSTAYTYYRLVVTDLNVVSSGLQITELEMYRGIPVYGFGLCNKKDIATLGMTVTEVNTATAAMWSDVFTPKSLNFAVYLDNTIIPNFADMTFSPVLLWSSNYVNIKGSTVIKNSYTRPDGMAITHIKYTVRGPNSSGYGYSRVDTVKEDGTSSNVAYVGVNSSSGTASYNDQQYRPKTVSIEINALNPNANYSNWQNTVEVYGVPYASYLKSINVALPPNQAPAITNPQITLTTHNEDVTLTAHIKDAEGDEAYYKVLVNEEVFKDYTTNNDTPIEYDVSLVIPADSFILGTNAVKIETYDGDKTGSYTMYVTRTDENPTIMGVLTGDFLSAVIGDPEGDPFKYRILVNDEVKRDWTEFMEAPATIQYRISTEDVILNVQNNVVIEAQDNLGGIGNCVFDFVGQYYNIMFVDEQGDFYSDDRGQMLKALDLGCFFIRTSSEEKPIIVKNTTGIPLKDIIISSDPNTNTVLELSLTKDGFANNNSITLPTILGHNDTYTIYIKARTDNEEAIGDNTLKLDVTAKHA